MDTENGISEDMVSATTTTTSRGQGCLFPALASLVNDLTVGGELGLVSYRQSFGVVLLNGHIVTSPDAEFGDFYLRDCSGRVNCRPLPDDRATVQLGKAVQVWGTCDRDPLTREARVDVINILPQYDVALFIGHWFFAMLMQVKLKRIMENITTGREVVSGLPGYEEGSRAPSTPAELLERLIKLNFKPAASVTPQEMKELSPALKYMEEGAFTEAIMDVGKKNIIRKDPEVRGRYHVNAW